MRIKINNLLVFVFVLFFNQVEGQNYGLKFASYDVNKDERTGLILAPKKGVAFEEPLELVFDFEIREPVVDMFGYIFRGFLNDEINIDLIHEDSLEITSKFSVVIGNQKTKLVHSVPTRRIKNNSVRIRIGLDPDKGEVFFALGDSVKYQDNILLPKGMLELFFGANQNLKCLNTDVPPMLIKDIKVYSGGKLNYYWPLNEDVGNVASENIKGAHATCTNPIWMNDVHSKWQLVFETSMSGHGQVAFDDNNERIYFLSNDTVKWYDFVSQSSGDIEVEGNNLLILKGNQAFYDPLSQKIVTYAIDRKKSFYLDLDNKKWSGAFYRELPDNAFYHHNKLFRLKDSSLYCFGGYGFHYYNNQLSRLDLTDSQWTEIPYKGDTIGPRYLAAGGLDLSGDTAYFLGGYGSSTGEQIVNPNYYYELLSYSFEDSTFEKRFSFDHIEEEFSFANSLVIDDESRKYYALVFPIHKYNCSLVLASGYLDRPEYSTMQTGIPYQFIDIRSFADLFYIPRERKLIAVTSLTSVDNQKTNFKVYSIVFPPNFEEPVVVTQESENASFIYAVVTFLFLLVAGVAVFFFYRKKQKKSKESAVVEESEEAPDKESDKGEESDTAQGTEVLNRPNSIYLLGGLSFFNREKEEITHLFSPLLKELLLLLVIYTSKSQGGITSYQLTEILWPGKTPKSAKNNRAVNIAKLRSILQQLDGCSLENNRNLWYLKCDDNIFFCDYWSVVRVVHDQLQMSCNRKIEELAGLLNHGSLLPTFNVEWLDEVKSEFSDAVIDAWVDCLKIIDIDQDPSLCIRSANMIFLLDPVNEEAVKIKCKVISFTTLLG
jgi:DNA-binding SARP family transcriptional activator